MVMAGATHLYNRVDTLVSNRSSEVMNVLLFVFTSSCIKMTSGGSSYAYGRQSAL